MRPVPRIDLPIDKEWAWGGATGTGVTVAVVDSGIDAAHPAVGSVERAVALRWDSETSQVITAEGPHDDLFGHGTACAGIIRRAAPDAALWSVRVLGSKLTGKGLVFAAGLRWAIKEGARVVNLSLSTGREDYFGLFHEIADEAAFAGVILVCATNNVPAPTYPAQFSSVISVAAHDGQDPFGIDANPAPPTDFGAPGIDVRVPWLSGSTIVTTGNSFAAPHVTGLVARLLSKHPQLTPYEVKTVLRAVASNAVPAAHTSAVPARDPAMPADVTEILRETSLLRSVPEPDLKAAAAASRLRSFRRGQVVFTRSDPGDTVIVVVSGRVKVTVRSADGGELTLAVIHSGGLLGELGVVDGGPRSADAETLEECQLLLIPRDTIRDICARVPSAAQALTSSIAATLRRLTEDTADLVFLDLPRRVAKILLSQPRGDDGVIRPRMSQEELAHQAGSTRQSVNAALRGFERRGWIEMRDRAVALKQPDALGRFAGTDVSAS